jgi:YVTN family beta-propeller protein
VEFAILGPIEVRRDGGALELGGPKQRSLLACLLLHANQVVPRDVLIEALWGETPPAGASRSLDSHVSRLRGLLGADRVARRAPGYALAVEAGELDLDRFEHLVAEGRAHIAANEPDAAAETLRAALSLWRGPALSDLLYEPVGRDAERLEERRLDATEDRIEADLARGLDQELVPELEELVRDHPTRERPVGQLMLALYRAGRQSDALAAFGKARLWLTAELGLEPGPQLRALERRILEQDPSLAASPAAPPADRPAPPRGRPLQIAALALVVVAAAVAVVLVARDAGRSSEPVTAGTSSLVSLRAGSRAVEPTDELPGPPAAIAAGADAVWLADSSNRQVLRADATTGKIVDRISLDGQPNGLAVGRSAIWAASTLSGSIARIDPATDEVTQTIRLGGADAAAIAYGGAGLWVADATDQALIEIDETAGEANRTITVDARPGALAVDSSNVWVADHDAGRVFAVDARTGDTVAVVQVGGGPAALALGLGGLWVANELDATVSRVDLATGAVIATIPVGSGPSGIAVSDGFVWVANQYAGTVARIDPRTNAAETVETGGQPAAIAAAGGTLWLGSGPGSGAHRGGTLRIATTSRFSSIDPAFQNFAMPTQWGKLAYDTLVTFRAAPGTAGLTLVPDLAVSLPPATNGGTTYAFRLRRGIRYSDGTPLLAADFRRAIERLFRVGSPGADYYSGLVGARACSRSPATCDLSSGIRTDNASGTVVFRLAAPDPDFLYELTPFSYGAPVPAGTPGRDVGSRPVPGTGPYRLLPWHGGEIRFERNPFFREWSHAAQPDGNPDAVVWRVYPSFDAEAAAVERGEADWIFGLVPPDRLRRLQLTAPGRLHVNATFVQDFVPLNTHRPPFDDVRVRRALNLAIDRSWIVRMYGGASAATPTCQPLPAGFLGHRPYCPHTRSAGRDGAWRGPDLPRARRLVAASGTKGQRVDVWGTTDALLPRALPAYVASVLRSLGYRTRLHLVRGSSITYAQRRSFQLSVDGDWLPDYPKPSSFLPQFFGCDGGYSNGYVCDPALDRMMSKATALQVQDPERAAALWAAIDRRIVDRAYWVPLVNSHSPELVSKRLRNFQYNPIWDFIAAQAWVR